MSKVVIIPMTEEQIKNCPFPDTARALGGMMVVKEKPLSPDVLEKLRREFEKVIKK